MLATIYMVIQTTSLSTTKPGIRITDMTPASLALPAETSTNPTQHIYCTAIMVHPQGSNTQYNIRVRIDGDGTSHYKLVIMGTDDDKDGASNKMDDAVVAFLTREGLSIPVSRSYDDAGVATTVSGVKRRNGENVWWEVVWGEVQDG